MDEKKLDEPLDVEKKLAHVPAGEIAVDAIAGAAAGAAMGALAGPPGMIAGAVIGGAVGTATGVGLYISHVEQDRRQEQLDRDIGVIGGDIGEASPDAPKSERGVFHAASLGIGGAGGAVPSEGVMQNVDAD